MKKVVLFLAVMLIAAPTFASTIEFTATPDPGNGTCEISYTITDGANPVAMGLNVDVLSGDPISAIDGIDSFFDVYIDQAYDMEQATPDSYVYVPNSPTGDPAADQTAAGAVTLPQSNFCISMGGLGGLDGNNLGTPPASGVVAVLHAAADSSGEITINQLRGGLVDTNGDSIQIAEGNLPLAFEITLGCFPMTDPLYALQAAQAQLYLDAGYSIDCWCNAYQCDGDAANDTNFFDWRVYTTDLTILANSWKLLIGDPLLDPCADMAHDTNFFGWRVYTTDLTILATNWKALTTALPGNCPRPD